MKGMLLFSSDCAHCVISNYGGVFLAINRVYLSYVYLISLNLKRPNEGQVIKQGSLDCYWWIGHKGSKWIPQFVTL
jgi:hypothetical protein